MSSANIHAGGKDDSFLGMMYWARVKHHTMLRMDFYLKLIYSFFTHYFKITGNGGN